MLATTTVLVVVMLSCVMTNSKVNNDPSDIHC